MGNFLKAINEAIPTNQGPATGKIGTGEGLNPKPEDGVKKGGFLNKVASVAQKSANFIQKGADVARGNWDINSVLQGILDKQLDSSTSKVGSFGKANFNKIKLGDDIVKKINAYGQDVEEKPVEVKPETAAVEANESFNRVFLSRVNEAITVFEKRNREELEKQAQEKGIPIVTKSGKKVRLDQLAAKVEKSGSKGKEKTRAQKMARFRERPTADRTTFKPIGDKVNAKTRLSPIVADVLGLEGDELKRYVNYITKNFAAVLNAIQQQYGPDSAYAKEEGSKPLDFTFQLKGYGRISKKEQDKLKNVKESISLELVQESVATNIADKVGRDGAEKLVRGMETIYPGKQIKFKEADVPEEDKPGEETGDGEPSGPVTQLTVENAIFELAGRTSFGEKGVQFTLKPISTDIIGILKDRDIKYLTYLLQSKDNEFKTAEGNSGIIYAYDESNQPINEITTEGVNFQWNGQEKLYTLSSDNKQLMGVKYSEGQYPINKSDVKPLSDGKNILMRPDKKSGYMKFEILQDLPTTKQFLINYKKGTAATPEEIKEADAFADPSPVQKAQPVQKTS